MRWQSNPNNPLTAPPSVLRWLQICTRSSALTTTPWSIEVWSRLKAKGRWWPTFWPVDLRVNPSSQQAADTIGWVPSLSLPSSGWAGSKKLKPSAHWCFLKLEYTGVYWSMHPEDQPVEERRSGRGQTALSSAIKTKGSDARTASVWQTQWSWRNPLCSDLPHFLRGKNIRTPSYVTSSLSLCLYSAQISYVHVYVCDFMCCV